MRNVSAVVVEDRNDLIIVFFVDKTSNVYMLIVILAMDPWETPKKRLKELSWGSRLRAHV